MSNITVRTEFGGGGTITLPILGAEDSARAVCQIPTSSTVDSRILVAGYAHDGTSQRVAIASFYPDGELDTSFATSGVGTYDLTTAANADDMAHAMVCLTSAGGSAGKPYALFSGRGSTNNMNWMIGKVLTSGALDTTFYTTGYRISSFENEDEAFRGISYLGVNNREFFASGYIWKTSRFNFAIAAFKSNGTLDTTFNTVGYNLEYMATGDSGALAVSYHTVGSGKVNQPIIAGPAFSGDWDFGVARYRTDGAIDTTFATDGSTTIGILASNDKPYSAQAVLEGIHIKIYVGGYAFNGLDNDFALVRLRSNGALDTGFSTDGKVTTDFSSQDDVIFTLTKDASRRNILVGGSSSAANNVNLAFARYTSDGMLDTSFNTTGKSTYDVSGSADVVASIATSSTAAWATVGFRSRIGGQNDFGVLRLHTNGTVATSGQLSLSFGTDGILTSDVSGATETLQGSVSSYNEAPDNLFGCGTSDNDVAILRYNGNLGTLDTTFDSDGVQLINLGGTETGAGCAYARLSSRRYIVIGGSKDGDLLYLQMKNNAGTSATLDTAFNTTGYAAINFSGTDVGYGANYSESADGGMAYGSDGATPKNCIIARFTTDGPIDTSFSTDGKTNFNPNGNDCVIKHAVHYTGQPFLVTGNDTTDLFAATFNPNGVLNTSFHTDGINHINFGATETLGGAAFNTLQNRYYLVGGNGTNFVVARVMTDASLDTTFFTSGKLTLTFGSTAEIARGMFFTGNKILIAGDNGTDWLLARLRTDGLLDTTFNTTGKRVVDVPGNGAMNSISPSNEGDICLFGSANGGADYAAACIIP